MNKTQYFRMRFFWRVAVLGIGSLLLLYGVFVERISLFSDLSSSKVAEAQEKNKGQEKLSFLPKSEKNGVCQEKRHFAFLKVPKAGSSTVQNIFFRFGTLRWLTFVLPVYANYIGRADKIYKKAIIPPPTGKRYDIMCNHVMYNHEEFSSILKPDSLFIGIVREPLPQLESFIYYYHSFDIPGEDKLTEYLENPYPYIVNKNIRPNPQTHYYGLYDDDRENPTAVRSFIAKIDKEFDFIIVLERLDESLLLMKRRFCWKITDILYVRKNTNRRNPRRARSHPNRNKHKRLALAEYRFYQHFEVELLKEITKDSVDFHQELQFYKKTLNSVTKFCSDRTRQWKDTFYIAKTKWNPETNVSAAVCHLMLLHEMEIMDLVGERQYGEVRWRELHPYVPILARKPRYELEASYNVTLPSGAVARKRSFNFKKLPSFRKRVKKTEEFDEDRPIGDGQI